MNLNKPSYRGHPHQPEKSWPCQGDLICSQISLYPLENTVWQKSKCSSQIDVQLHCALVMPDDLRKIHTNGNAGLKYYNMIIVQNKNLLESSHNLWLLLSNVHLKMCFKPIQTSKRSAILFTREYSILLNTQSKQIKDRLFLPFLFSWPLQTRGHFNMSKYVLSQNFKNRACDFQEILTSSLQ